VVNLIATPHVDVLFPTYIGALIWAGLYLRDDRLRTFVELTAQPA
jgi:hypothetical protein